MPTKLYPGASIVSSTETVEILAASLKKKFYPEASVIAQTEVILTDWGLKWFLVSADTEEVKTGTVCSAVPLVRRFPRIEIAAFTETNCGSLAVWPEPPAPTASISCAGKDLHKQLLKSENSHQISIAINCEQTTVAAVSLLQIVFEITKSGDDVPVLKKTRFDAPGGIILDIVKDQAEGKVLLLADLQLRPNQINFSGNEAEFDFAVIVENESISQRADVATGTLILSKD